MKKINTFKDLRFEKTPVGLSTRMNFKNGYGVSVITIDRYCNKDNPFEVAILYNDSITYNTDITNDVLSDLSIEEVTKIMKKVQELD